MNYLKDFWNFLKKDTWQSWLVSLALAFIVIKFAFFPALGWVTGTHLPLVVVESCSMYHESGFDEWWTQNGQWYSGKDIDREDFESYSFKDGISKGDIIFVWGRSEVKKGDVIIFNSEYRYPLIHRVVSLEPLSTKGDHNPGQLPAEQDISSDAIVGRAVGRIPGLGWIKLVFFEAFKDPEQRGFCR